MQFHLPHFQKIAFVVLNEQNVELYVSEMTETVYGLHWIRKYIRPSPYPLPEGEVEEKYFLAWMKGYVAFPITAILNGRSREYYFHCEHLPFPAPLPTPTGSLWERGLSDKDKDSPSSLSIYLKSHVELKSGNFERKHWKSSRATVVTRGDLKGLQPKCTDFRRQTDFLALVPD